MNIRLLAGAVAAALMALSTASFAQNAVNSAGASGASRGQDNPGANETSGAGTPVAPGVTSGSSAAGAGSTVACDSITGMERDRCLRDQNRGSNSGAYTPQRPSMSQDKNDPQHPNVKSADQEKSRSQ
jgi:hypothetical protein